jgi:hypothetical protein
MESYEELVNEILEKIPKFKLDMKFEVINSIFPDSTVISEVKNVNSKFTKPLALSSKDKIKIRKRDTDVLNDFLNYKSSKREKGDILVVKEIYDKFAYCENISRPKEINERYFNDENIKYIKINYRDIIEGNIKLLKRVRN